MLNDQNFVLYAAKHYDNPECHTVEEFNDDLNRLKYLKKIFKRYRDTGDINIRLTVNYIITFYNLFGVDGSTNMLFFKLKDYTDILKPVLMMLNYLPRFVNIDGQIVSSETISIDHGIVKMLREI